MTQVRIYRAELAPFAPTRVRVYRAEAVGTVAGIPKQVRVYRAEAVATPPGTPKQVRIYRSELHGVIRRPRGIITDAGVSSLSRRLL